MKCRVARCNGQVFIAETINGKRMALNRDPDPTGTYALRPVAFGLPLAEYVEPDDRPDEEHLYLVHAATCAARQPPRARGWRGRQNGPQAPTSGAT